MEINYNPMTLIRKKELTRNHQHTKFTKHVK